MPHQSQRGRRASGIVGKQLTFAGTLRCVEPEEYWTWLDRAGEPPAIILNPRRQFCFDSQLDWCREQRAAGCCHLSAHDFEIVTTYHEHGSEDEDMVTKPYRELPVRPLAPVADAPAVQWEPWTLSGRDGEATISIDRSGVIRLSPVADHLLHRPAYVQLVASRRPRMIGLRVAGKDEPGVIAVRGRGKNGGFSVSCRAFLAFYGIEQQKTLRWRASIVNGALVIDLDAEPLAEWGSKQKADTA